MYSILFYGQISKLVHKGQRLRSHLDNFDIPHLGLKHGAMSNAGVPVALLF